MGCSCGRSISESLMDEFWSNLKFRNLTPKDYIDRFKKSKETNKELLEELFVPSEPEDLVNKAAKKLYNKFVNSETDRKYFFISLMVLLYDHTHEFKICFIELDKITGCNMLTDNKISKAEWLAFLRFHCKLVSTNGIPEHILSDGNIKLDEIYNATHVEEVVKHRANHDLTIEDFIRNETKLLKNDRHIRDMIYEQYSRTVKT